MTMYLIEQAWRPGHICNTRRQNMALRVTNISKDEVTAKDGENSYSIKNIGRGLYVFTEESPDHNRSLYMNDPGLGFDSFRVMMQTEEFLANTSELERGGNWLARQVGHAFEKVISGEGKAISLLAHDKQRSILIDAIAGEKPGIKIGDDKRKPLNRSVEELAKEVFKPESELRNSFDKIVDSVSVTMESYIKEHKEDFFETMPKTYTMQVGISDKHREFHNPLEDANYSVEEGGVILKGTAGEMWTTKLENALKKYKLPDGSPLTEETLKKNKGMFVSVKVEGGNKPVNFAMPVPKDISFTVHTSWADLTINKPGADHGNGDYLVCRKGSDGKPDLSDVWVVNGKTFGKTYNTREDLLRNNIDKSTQTVYKWRGDKTPER